MINYKSLVDTNLNLEEFLSKYNNLVYSGSLSKEYLIMRWKWMNQQATWEDVRKEYVKTNAWKNEIAKFK